MTLERRHPTPRPIRHGRWRLLTLALVGIATLAACKKDRDASAAASASSEAADRKTAPTAVVIASAAVSGAGIVSAPVTRSDLTPKNEMPGTVEAPRDALVVVNTRASGVVETLSVDVGDLVTADQLVATIRSPELSDAQADYRRAVSAEQHTSEVFKRTETLEQQGLLSPKRLADDRFAWQQSQLAIDKASQKIKIFGGALGDATGTITIKSPIAGTVSARSANRGEAVAENAPLFTVIDLSRLVLELRAPTGIRIEPGTKVTFTVEGLGDKSLSATVKSAGAVLDPETRRFLVRCSPLDPDKLLRPGMFVSASVPGKTLQTLSVPEAAVVMMDGGPVVFIASDGGRYERRSVTLGVHADGRVAIESGLAERENVVTEGAFWVRSELQKSELEE